MKAIALTEVATAAELNRVKEVVNNNADATDGLRKILAFGFFVCATYVFMDWKRGRQFNREICREISELKKRIDILEGKDNEEAEFFEE